jgi:FkbM family methyltransferase
MFRTPDFLQDTPLFKRLIPSLSKRYAKWLKPRFMIESRHGVNLLLDQLNLVDRVVLTRGYWEKKQLDYLLSVSTKLRQTQQTQSSMLFLDIGSHWGLYSIVMKKHFPDIEVIAFEPEVVNHAQLLANLLINDMLSEAQVHRVAVSDHEGEIYLTRPEHNRGVTHVTEGVESVPSRNAVVEKVRCLTVDSLLGTVKDTVIVAKIDVEGHEVSVLRGMARLLRDNQCLLQIESFPENMPMLENLMTEAGFSRLKTIDRDHYFTNSSAFSKNADVD